MGRSELPEESAMLFLFPGESVLQFWMLNTLIPLDIVFVSGAFQVVDVQTMHPEPDTPPERLTVYTSAAPARYAIEMNAGMAAACGIVPGAEVTLALQPQPAPGE
jgi:hypothetical protein